MLLRYGSLRDQPSALPGTRLRQEAGLRTQWKIAKLAQAHPLKQVIGFGSFRAMPGEACPWLAQEALRKILDGGEEAGVCSVSLHGSSPSLTHHA